MCANSQNTHKHTNSVIRHARRNQACQTTNVDPRVANTLDGLACPLAGYLHASLETITLDMSGSDWNHGMPSCTTDLGCTSCMRNTQHRRPISEEPV